MPRSSSVHGNGEQGQFAGGAPCDAAVRCRAGCADFDPGNRNPSLGESEIAALKDEAVQAVQDNSKLAQVMNDSIFSFAELGFQEVETSRYLTELLEENGFTIERGVAGIPTAWTATWGSGEPVIALGSDIDGIPKASQKPGVAYHDPLVEGGPGHGEGHNSGQAVNVVATLAVKDIMERENIPGTLMLWPGVAEELLATKAYFVREGVFDDVDAVIFTHVGDNLETSYGQANGTGLVSVEYTFEGESAHSAVRPWARAQRPRRRGSDEHRLERPEGAPAAGTTVPFRDHERRGSAERRPVGGIGLVLHP